MARATSAPMPGQGEGKQQSSQEGETEYRDGRRFAWPKSEGNDVPAPNLRPNGYARSGRQAVRVSDKKQTQLVLHAKAVWSRERAAAQATLATAAGQHFSAGGYADEGIFSIPSHCWIAVVAPPQSAKRLLNNSSKPRWADLVGGLRHFKALDPWRFKLLAITPSAVWLPGPTRAQQLPHGGHGVSLVKQLKTRWLLEETLHQPDGGSIPLPFNNRKRRCTRDEPLEQPASKRLRSNLPTDSDPWPAKAPERGTLSASAILLGRQRRSRRQGNIGGRSKESRLGQRYIGGTRHVSAAVQREGCTILTQGINAIFAGDYSENRWVVPVNGCFSSKSTSSESGRRKWCRPNRKRYCATGEPSEQLASINPSAAWPPGPTRAQQPSQLKANGGYEFSLVKRLRREPKGMDPLHQPCDGFIPSNNRERCCTRDEPLEQLASIGPSAVWPPGPTRAQQPSQLKANGGYEFSLVKQLKIQWLFKETLRQPCGGSIPFNNRKRCCTKSEPSEQPASKRLRFTPSTDSDPWPAKAPERGTLSASAILLGKQRRFRRQGNIGGRSKESRLGQRYIGGARHVSAAAQLIQGLALFPDVSFGINNVPVAQPVQEVFQQHIAGQQQDD